MQKLGRHAELDARQTADMEAYISIIRTKITHAEVGVWSDWDHLLNAMINCSGVSRPMKHGHIHKTFGRLVMCNIVEMERRHVSSDGSIWCMLQSHIMSHLCVCLVHNFKFSTRSH